MSFPFYGVVTVNDVPGEIVSELSSIIIKDFNASGTQLLEVSESELRGSNLPSEILTMSGEFTQEQSEVVDEYFFNDSQNLLVFFDGSYEKFGTVTEER